MADGVKVSVTAASPNKGMAFLGIFLTWLGFLIVFLTKKDDHYAMHYAKQGLVLGIGWVIASVAGFALAFVPVVGWILQGTLWVVLFVFWIIGIVYSLSGEEKDIPIIGSMAEKFNF